MAKETLTVPLRSFVRTPSNINRNKSNFYPFISCFVCVCVSVCRSSISLMNFVEKDEISSRFENDKTEISTTRERESILNCKTNVVVYFPSVRYHWTKSKQNDNNKCSIYSLSTSCFTTLLCVVDTVASHFLSIKLTVARDWAGERLTTTTMATSTHQNRSEICNMFWKLCKGLTPVALQLEGGVCVCVCRWHQQQNEGIKETALPNSNSHSTHSFTHSWD